MSLKLAVNAKERRRKLTYEWQFHNLPYTKVMAAKDHGKTKLESDLP